MPNELLDGEPIRQPTFQEFKEAVLRPGADAGFLNRLADLEGRIPRLIRILFNIDPTGLTSAADQLFSEQSTEREKENILRAIYELATRIWNVEAAGSPSLPDDKFKFLYYVYQRSETNVFWTVDADEILNLLALSQQRTMSIGQYLEKHGLIEFKTWYTGIKILHKGIIRVEAELLGSKRLPSYVSPDAVKSIEERIRLRFRLLQELHAETKEDTFKFVLHEKFAQRLGLDHHRLLSESLPYLEHQGWIDFPTADSIRITEEGIDRAKAVLA